MLWSCVQLKLARVPIFSIESPSTNISVALAINSLHISALQAYYLAFAHHLPTVWRVAVAFADIAVGASFVYDDDLAKTRMRSLALHHRTSPSKEC